MTERTLIGVPAHKGDRRGAFIRFPRSLCALGRLFRESMA